MATYVPWNTPFSEHLLPSVATITEQCGAEVILVVAPDGVDRYPKYLVRFSHVIALRYGEEAFSHGSQSAEREGVDSRHCAYEWIGSPMLESYRTGKEIFGWRNLRHFVVFGGDNSVDLIADSEPEFETLTKPTEYVAVHKL